MCMCVCVLGGGGGAMSLTQEKTFFFENITKQTFFQIEEGQHLFLSMAVKV